MDYKEYAPPKELTHLIECYWTNTLEPGDFQQDYDYIIPDGNTEAIFMLNGNYLRNDEKNKNEQLVEYCSLVPAFQNAVKVYQKPYTTCLGARFKPGAIQHLTNYSLADLSKPTYPLQELMPELADLAMNEAIKKAPATFIINKINEWLIKQATEPKINYLISGFISEAIKKKGSVLIKDFCNTFGVHRSTLEKNFKQEIGLSPKQYTSLIRFNYLLNRMLFNSSSLTKTGYDLGYFDQSHMIKDFKKIVGVSPSDFLNKNFTVPKLAALSISNKSEYI
ncbi:MAG: helix-turn-helix transcriptional regulator [Candidatus Paceibacterota bacterium]